MDVNLSLPIEDREMEELCRILDCSEETLPEQVKDHLIAAALEYIEMYLGQRVLKRGSDIREHRLFLLIKHVFVDRIPGEAEVCRFFQTSQTESRALLKAVMSKYQYQLHSAIESTMRTVMSNATSPGGDGNHSITINNLNIVEQLNRELAEIDGNLPQISKRRNSVSTYEIEEVSYNRLKARLGF